MTFSAEEVSKFPPPGMDFPTSFTFDSDGDRVLFLRTVDSLNAAGVKGLYSYDIREGRETLIADQLNKSDAEAQRVVDYSLLRSAELSLENDFPFFVILSNDSESREIIRDDPACNFKNKKSINQRKCMRYKSIGDLTSAFLKDPLEVETGTNIIKDGDYEGKALFSSVSVYKVITRKYNLNRNLLFENEMGQQTMTNNASEVLDWIPIVNPNSQ